MKAAIWYRLNEGEFIRQDGEWDLDWNDGRHAEPQQAELERFFDVYAERTHSPKINAAYMITVDRGSGPDYMFGPFLVTAVPQPVITVTRCD